MSDNATISSLLHSLNVEVANAKKWQSKAALQAAEIKKLQATVERLRSDKKNLLAEKRAKCTST